MSGCCGGHETKTEENKGCCCEAITPELQIKVDRYLRGIAGAMILISVALNFLHSPLWIWFTAFIGLNLLQSAFTQWCPMITILKKLFK